MSVVVTERAIDRRPTSPTPARYVFGVGAVVVAVASTVGFVRALPATGMPVHPMPLRAMPEMLVAGVGFLLMIAAGIPGTAPAIRSTAAPSSARRRLVALVATAALSIDISKTSTLGFVIPGMREEYGVSAGTASLLPIAGLSGAAVGAAAVGVLVQRLGRRRTYLTAALAFTATSMCACMPTFAGNVVMCFLMGTSVGGMAPLIVSVLGDLFSDRARGHVTVALAILAAGSGYLVASGSALWLEPDHGWRVLWLIGAPTGLLLAALTALVPERIGRARPVATAEQSPQDRDREQAQRTLNLPVQRVHALLMGVLAFGLIAWVPTLARAGGTAVTGNTLTTIVSVAMLPGVAVVAWCYRQSGPVAVVTATTGATALLLVAVTLTAVGTTAALPVAGALTVALLMVNVGSAMLLPVAANLAPDADRDRACADVSLWNRFGGLLGPAVLALVVSSIADVVVAVAVLALLCAAMTIVMRQQSRRPIRSGLHPE